MGVEFFSKDIQHNNEKYRIQIWDTAGEELFKSIAVNFYKECHGVILCYDVTNRNSFSNLEYWLKEIKNNAHVDISILLVGTKIDLIDKREISTKQGEEFAIIHKTLFYEVSSLSNLNDCVGKAFQLLINQLLGMYSQDGRKSLFNPRLSSLSKEEGTVMNAQPADCCST